jgi:hypothetical protein
MFCVIKPAVVPAFFPNTTLMELDLPVHPGPLWAKR